MATEFSSLVAAQPHGDDTFSVHTIDLKALGISGSPVVVLDHFRVRGRPFTPHPHAGFCAVTYVLQDSQTSLRTRDSQGRNVITDPGGIVWTQAGSGVIHEELPAETDGEVHGIQVFVNVSSKNKLAAPQLLRLTNSDVPLWRSGAGDRVRIVVGSFQNVSSPLVPAEPFTFLDAQLRQEISLYLLHDHNALVYVLDGDIAVRTDGRRLEVSREHAVALHGSGDAWSSKQSSPRTSWSCPAPKSVNLSWCGDRSS